MRAAGENHFQILSRTLLLLPGLFSFALNAQTVTTDPAVPAPDEPATITFDVTGTSFATKNLNDVWLWTWLAGPPAVDAPTNVNPATGAQDAAKVTRSSSDPNIYFITITATTFFNKPASQIQKVGVLIKGRDWADGQTSDKFINFSISFNVVFTSPTLSPVFVDTNDDLDIAVSTNENATITISLDGTPVASSSVMVSTFSYTHTVIETSGQVEVTVEADNGTESREISFIYIVRTSTVSAARPPGIVDGINYNTNKTKATLSLWAPDKTSVYVTGDFNNWTITPDYQMKQDGEHFWLEITGLTQGIEYAYQYLVNETLFMADPYSDKILDPDDQYIPASSYQNLKSYPAGALHDQWYFNRAAVLQTGQQPYNWQVTDFQKPAKEKLVIYELLIRDFFGPTGRTYKNLQDTISYFKRLGVNAVELMPVMEFNGNEGWGYNPTFMFAPDKYYGPKKQLKVFIDKCHEQGIAVIFDIAMNHQDLPNPYVMMDFDFSPTVFRPTVNNKWFNQTARHPFNVFFDMNHESSYTHAYLDTVNHYWLNEYHIDGFRFDLSKGFTQTNNPTNVSAWSAYDASRIAILERMADQVWTNFPDAYIILEHFAENSEEKTLAEYRSGEGKGMMLWDNLNYAYGQNTMGYSDGSDFSGIFHGTKNWNVMHAIGYMESHDEERIVYKDLAYGNAFGTYATSDSTLAVRRVKGAVLMFYTIPGPKMVWEFGEMGYDLGINRCTDGTYSDGCRLSPKPPYWEYIDGGEHANLFDFTRDLLRLRNDYDLFTEGNVTFMGGTNLLKQVTIRNSPYTATPSSADDMNAQIVSNFALTYINATVSFPHEGTWYDYYEGSDPVEVSGTFTVKLAPGQYKLYTDVPIESPLLTAVESDLQPPTIQYFPNPASAYLQIVPPEGQVIRGLTLHTLQGNRLAPARLSDERWDVSTIPSGLYMGAVDMGDRRSWIKLIVIH